MRYKKNQGESTSKPKKLLSRVEKNTPLKVWEKKKKRWGETLTKKKKRRKAELEKKTVISIPTCAGLLTLGGDTRHVKKEGNRRTSDKHNCGRC